ncbi:ion channel [Acidipila sp. EB88]|uniref:ion channel n=1 Tax=Acidipila sp. EB88 TaxID=2305226 RepID=UPI001315ABC8|nr:ion channel [Acidipila sp. EB88]
MRKAKTQSGQDLGFGDTFGNQARLINQDGSFNVRRSRRRVTELFGYATLLRVSWSTFLLCVIALFLALNLVFGALYLACGPGALANSGPAPRVSLPMRAFFFSVHTLATIGYGNVVPVGEAANVLVTLESFIGLSAVSLVTGLLFSRFSRSQVRLRFSRVVVLRHSPSPGLLIRLTNLHRSELIHIEASALLTSFDPEREQVRRYVPLALERSRIEFLPLAWTILHPITPDSPFFEVTPERLKHLRGELILQVTGIDEASGQAIHARASYTADNLVWGATFQNIYVRDPATGLLDLDMERFDSVDMQPPPAELTPPLPDPAPGSRARVP